MYSSLVTGHFFSLREIRLGDGREQAARGQREETFGAIRHRLPPQITQIFADLLIPKKI